SILDDRILQKKVVHENTWHNAATYHWDFSLQDYRRMIAGKGVRVLELQSREFFCPQFLLGGSIERFRRKERLLQSLPVLRHLGGDVMLAVEKRRGKAEENSRAAHSVVS